LLAILTGCTNLKAVRGYVHGSAGFAAQSDLAERYRDTHHREEPYLDPVDDLVEKATDARRQASFQNLVKVQRTIVTDLKALATLAGEETSAPGFDLDRLDHDLAPAANLGVHPEQLEAIAALTKLVTRGGASSLQKRAIHNLVARADPHFQKRVAEMRTLVHLYHQTHRNERAKVLNVLKVHIPYTRDPAGHPATASLLLVNRLARAHLQAKLEAYDAVEPA
jgi:hypothetical protein